MSASNVASKVSAGLVVAWDWAHAWASAHPKQTLIIGAVVGVFGFGYVTGKWF